MASLISGSSCFICFILAGFGQATKPAFVRKERSPMLVESAKEALLDVGDMKSVEIHSSGHQAHSSSGKNSKHERWQKEAWFGDEDLWQSGNDDGTDKSSPREDAETVQRNLDQQRRQWHIPAKPATPDFFFRSVPSQAIPTIERAQAISPEILSKIFANSKPHLNQASCSTCALVGGAVSLMKQSPAGSEIDAHDCVFRLNHGVSSYPAEDRATVSGEKTTHYLFYCCYEHDEQHRLDHTGARDWIFLPTRKEGLDWAISALSNGSMGHDLVVMDPRFNQRVKNDAGLSHRPLSGTFLLSVAMQMCDSPIDVYGEDVSDTMPYNAPSHEPKEDHQWFRHLEEAGRVRIH